MNSKVKDISGLRFGKLVVLRFAYTDRACQAYWLCLCDCGKEKVVFGHNLRRGNTKSCGCGRSKSHFKHGLCYHPLFAVRNSMLARCYNLNSAAYKNYGGRGISVCRAWQNDVVAFYKWAMKSGYKRGLTIERINNNGNYTPRNCTWITRGQQNKNKRNVR